ncbi:MAG: hypothetical protein AAF203_10240, partial [Pseudomonadota bacterium]
FFSQAKITLERGSLVNTTPWVNRSHIDSFHGKVNLNFTYRGCDKNPSADKIKMKVNPDCLDAKEYQLKNPQDGTAVVGNVGEILTSYDEPQETCLESEKVTKRLHDYRSFLDLYNQLQAKGCTPSHIVLTNLSNDKTVQRMHKSLRDRTLCSLPRTRIRKNNFPLDQDPRFHLKANDKGFTIGNHSRYWFDHDSKEWCVKYKEKEKKCGVWGSPIPLAYQDDGDKQFHLKATVSLSPGGQAVFRAINKTFRSQAALFAAQKAGELVNTDTSKGRIEFRTFRNDRTGLIRTKIESFRTDGPNATPERSMNLMARNIFGDAATYSWCSKEHCFYRPPTHAAFNKLSCQTEENKTSQTKACYNSCDTENGINMSHGANLGACYSCVGITPGDCATAAETVGKDPKDKQNISNKSVAILRSNFTENENFAIDPLTGEYRLKNNVTAGLSNMFSQMILKPANPGCHEGISSSSEEFLPSRSVQSNDGK